MTVAAFGSEVCEANRRLLHLLGIEPTVFAYPCGEAFVGRGRSTKSLVPLIAERFRVGRTFNDLTPNSPAHVDLAQTRCVNSDRRTFDDLLPLLETTVGDGAWLVLGGHEVGGAGEGDDTTWMQTIEAVVSWCRGNDVWIDTIGNAAGAVSTFRRERTVSRRRRPRWLSRRGGGGTAAERNGPGGPSSAIDDESPIAERAVDASRPL
jgi:hypothetical protein